jgi:type VI protein secretion system component Hcp
MLTQSTLHFRWLLSRGRLLAVLATAGLALTSAAPASADTVGLNYGSVQWTYTQQKRADGAGPVATQRTTPAGKAS